MCTEERCSREEEVEDREKGGVAEMRVRIDFQHGESPVLSEVGVGGLGAWGA